MSVAEKLGKMRIPGFRSGKKWKMVISTFGYFWIFMILLAIISVNQNNQEQSNKIHTTIEEDQKNITIKYSASKLNILNSAKSSEGHVYLVMYVTIENHGYSNFYTNPKYFYVIAENIKYEFSWYDHNLLLQDHLESMIIRDGETTKGSMTFTVLSTVQNYELQYENPIQRNSDNYEIIYKRD